MSNLYVPGIGGLRGRAQRGNHVLKEWWLLSHMSKKSKFTIVYNELQLIFIVIWTKYFLKKDEYKVVAIEIIFTNAHIRTWAQSVTEKI